MARSILRSITVLASTFSVLAPAFAQETELPGYLSQRFQMSRMMGGGGGDRTFFRENYVTAVMMEFRQTAGEDQVLDSSDIDAARAVATAETRSKIMQRVMSNDIDGDGVVTQAELTQALSAVSADRARPRGNVEALVKGYMQVDADSDGRITMAEVNAFAKDRPPSERQRHDRRGSGLMEELIALDPNGDGKLTGNELDEVARAAFATYDKDGDGMLNEAESAPILAAMNNPRQAMLQGGCAFTKASPRARVIFVGGYEAGALSDVTVAGQDQETETQEIEILPGNEPLYIVAATYTPMVWRLKGATGRVERFVTSAKVSRTGGGVGVAGLPKDKVEFPGPRCLQANYETGAANTNMLKAAMKRSTGKPADEVLVAYTLQQMGIAKRRAQNIGNLPVRRQPVEEPQAAATSPSLRFIANKPKPRESYPQTVDNDTYGSMLRFSPGGYAEIDPVTVVTAPKAKAEKYEVLPQEAGLVQLLAAGSIERVHSPQGMGTFRILKPIKRFPAGLNGAHLVTFILAEGVPLPAGSPGHSTVINEATGETISGPMMRRNQARDIDPFEDL